MLLIDAELFICVTFIAKFSLTFETNALAFVFMANSISLKINQHLILNETAFDYKCLIDALFQIFFR